MGFRVTVVVFVVVPPGPATPAEIVQVCVDAGQAGAFQVAVADDASEKVLVIVAPAQFPPTLGFQLPGGTAGLLVFVHPDNERFEVPPGFTVVGLAVRLVEQLGGRKVQIPPEQICPAPQRPLLSTQEKPFHV